MVCRTPKGAESGVNFIAYNVKRLCVGGALKHKRPERIEKWTKRFGELEVKYIDETDISEEQSDFHFSIEMAIWEKLGLDDILAWMWSMGHKRTILQDFQAGIKTLITINGSLVM